MPGLEDLLQNPYLLAGVNAYLSAIQTPRLAGRGAMLARGGLAGLNTLMAMPYYQAQTQQAQAKAGQLKAQQDVLSQIADPKERAAATLAPREWAKGQVGTDLAANERAANTFQALAEQYKGTPQEGMYRALEAQYRGLKGKAAAGVTQGVLLDPGRQLSVQVTQEKLKAMPAAESRAEKKLTIEEERAKREQEKFEWEKTHPKGSKPPLPGYENLTPFQAQQAAKLRDGFQKEIGPWQGIEKMNEMGQATDPKNAQDVTELAVNFVRMANSFNPAASKGRMTQSELDMVTKARSTPEAFTNLWQRAWETGSLMTGEQITRLKTVMQRMADIAKGQQEEVRGRYQSNAQAYGVPEDLIFGAGAAVGVPLGAPPSAEAGSSIRVVPPPGKGEPVVYDTQQFYDDAVRKNPAMKGWKTYREAPTAAVPTEPSAAPVKSKNYSEMSDDELLQELAK